VQKSALIRAVYAELRKTLGPEASALELVRLANHIVQAYTDETAVLIEHGEARTERSLRNIPVDLAMKEESWRLYAQEVPPNGDEPAGIDVTTLKKTIDKYLGPEWRHLLPTGQL